MLHETQSGLSRWVLKKDELALALRDRAIALFDVKKLGRIVRADATLATLDCNQNRAQLTLSKKARNIAFVAISFS